MLSTTLGGLAVFSVMIECPLAATVFGAARSGCSAPGPEAHRASLPKII